jgi:hypothetical protein
VAERHDRIHLKATHFQLARHLEAMGDPAGAVRHYEAAGTGAAEVGATAMRRVRGLLSGGRDRSRGRFDVWDLSIVQGPFSAAPCQTLAFRFATVCVAVGAAHAVRRRGAGRAGAVRGEQAERRAHQVVGGVLYVLP